MEALGGFSDGEWESFAAMFSSEEVNQSHIPMANYSNELQLPNNGGSSWFYSLDAFVPNLQSNCEQDIRSCSSCSTTNNSTTSVLIPNSSDYFMPIDERNFGSSFFSDVLIEEVDKALAAAAAEEDSDAERFIENNVLLGSHPPPSPVVDSTGTGNKPIALKRKVNDGDISDNQKKKSRISSHGQKKKKTEENRRGESVEEEGNTGGASEGQSSISYSSDQEENGYEEGNGGGSGATSDGGFNRKSRASRGSATDPQSLYARKRRERINERLRILQKLVPNGTKVDISTMLEEAVHYVKFLQLQIKLLSSDEMWMFAPLAYNGMDLGLHQKFSPFLSR